MFLPRILNCLRFEMLCMRWIGLERVFSIDRFVLQNKKRLISWLCQKVVCYNKLKGYPLRIKHSYSYGKCVQVWGRLL